MSAFEGKADII